MIDLKFDHVSKRYRVQQAKVEATPPRHPLLAKLQRLRRGLEDFWAIRDVSFEVRKSESLGIIGHNGAGKSTILKLLSNITTPSSGEIQINGRLSALIEVGSGFHPELTGRENVYLSGSILGMRRREITKKLDDIVDFSGIGQFIDTPVKRYSSGMYVRLGFSIAAHLDPDILLLDEVLAVGDAAFQSRCLQRINELKRSGRTIVFISHDLGAVERLCDRVLLMHRGEVAASGKPREVITEYVRSTITPAAPASLHSASSNLPPSVEIKGIDFHQGGSGAHAFTTGGPIRARLKYMARAPVEDAVFEIFFYSLDGELSSQLTTELSGSPINLKPGEYALEFSCPVMGLQPGLYQVDATVKQRGAPQDIDWQYRCATLRVEPGKKVRGSFFMTHDWELLPESSVTACEVVQ
jgi:ABC-type polysaccharide/polyol phosphate transport system ATPase subunit